MKSFYFFVGVLCGLSVSVAQASTKVVQVTGEMLAEHAYFNFAKSRNISVMVDSSSLLKAHRHQIQAYLESHHIEKLNTHAKWSEGSSTITILDSSGEMKLDFASMPKQGVVSANGILINASKDFYFTDVVKRFERALKSKKATIQTLLIDEAVAESDPIMSVYGAIMYWTGIDQLSACLGAEGVTRSFCSFRTNAAMIKSYIRADEPNNERISSFVCSKYGLDSITLVDASKIAISVTAIHDPKGRLTQLNTSQDGSPTCSYQLKNERLVGVTVEGTTEASYCNGSVLGQYDSQPQPFKKGDRPKVVATLPIPPSRLESCCRDTACKNEINEFVKARPSEPFIKHSGKAVR